MISVRIMKTYKNLWDEFISQENFDVAVRKAVKSKKNKKQTKFFLENKDALIDKLRQDLIADRFKTSKYRVFNVYEPKKREIFELPLYPDHIVHHALINVLGPIWQKRFIQDSYACIPGRGIHSAAQRAMRFVKQYRYVLQCDVRKFYPSIDHNIMMDIISKKIHDRRLLRLLRKIVFSIEGGKNLPIGNLTSQWMGNLYMTELDLFVKHVLKCKNYVRYSDDFCVFHDDKKFLTDVKSKINQFVNDNLNLSLSKSVVVRAEGMQFVGFRLFKKFILLRNRTVKKIKNRIFNVQNVLPDKKIQASFASTYGVLAWANTYNLKNRLRKSKKWMRFVADFK